MIIFIVILQFILFFIEYLLFKGRKHELFIYAFRYLFINIFTSLIAYCLSDIIYVLVVLLIIKILLDKLICFKKISFSITNWEKYYSKKPLKIIESKRENNINYIINVLNENNFSGKKALEYGGGNSKVAERISKEFEINKFTIVDSNEYGIELLNNRKINKLDKNCVSIFDYKGKKEYDLIYSIGLIEHFQNKELVNCINEHFHYSKKGGYVLFTFPVLTFKYRVVRMVYEIFNKWQFTDEIPLNPKYVEKLVSKKGKILHSSINKSLILPQAIILIKTK